MELMIYNNELTNQPEPTSKLFEAMQNFLTDKEVAKTTKELYRHALNNFFQYVRAHVSPITKNYLKEYKANLLATYKRGSASSFFRVVKMFFQWLANEGKMQDIASNIKNIKLDSTCQRVAYLSNDDINSVLSTLPNKTDKDLRNTSIFYLLLTTGLRCNEVANILLEDIQERGDKTIIYVKGKGRTEKNDFVIVPNKVMQSIKRYLKTRTIKTIKEPLFTSTSNKATKMTCRTIERVIKNIYSVANLESKNYKVHTLRHTAITQALTEGATLQEVQQMARHKNINTTLIYSHNLDLLNNSASERIAKQYL